MTNLDLYCLLQVTPLHKPALQKDGTTYFAYSEAMGMEFLILTDGDGEKVGCVIPSSIDVYLYITDAFRGKGYMSKFLDSGLLWELYPECVNASIAIADSLDMVKRRYAIAKKYGFHITNESDVLACFANPEQYCFDDDYDMTCDEVRYINIGNYRDVDKNMTVAAELYFLKEAYARFSSAGYGVFGYKMKYWVDMLKTVLNKVSSQFDEGISCARVEECYDIHSYPSGYRKQETEAMLKQRIQELTEKRKECNVL